MTTGFHYKDCPTMYPCRVVHPSSKYEVGGGPCANSASYFAIDNRAKHGHVCRFCWRTFSHDEQSLYSKES